MAMRHDAVERAVAVPVPDERLGEKVGIAVMLRPGRELTAGELLAHLDAAGPLEVRHQLFVDLVRVPSPQTALLEAEPQRRALIETAIEPRLRRLRTTQRAVTTRWAI